MPRHHRLVPRIVAATCGALLIAAAPASATLRTPHLERECPTGYAYSEVRVGPFLVEGCNKVMPPRGTESARRRFHGELEVNGLLVAPTGEDDVIATVDRPSGSALDVGRLHRSARTELVLDPRIGGQVRRTTIYSGRLDLEATRSIRDSQFDPPGGSTPLYGGAYETAGLARAERTSSISGAGVLARGAALRTRAGNVTGRTTIPVGVGSSLLGLRLARDIDGVPLTDRGMTLEATMKLGSGAPALLGDAAGSATLQLVDGEGLQLTDLRFRIGHIGIPGIGGFDHFRIAYSEADDSWSGGFGLDLGDLFPGLDFSATVSASTGVPTAMRLEVEPLNIPLGQTGIVLQSVRAGFILDPLTLSGGAGVTAGPQVAGASLIRADGDLTIALEPNFRMEAGGSVRILPVGAVDQLATGSMSFILDSSGFLALRSRADYRATFLGFGISANIHGDGAYSTTGNLFNIGAGATGRLELGFLGGVDVIDLGAVVSSDGYGACGNVYPFISAGVGQRWDGHLELLMGCDLQPYRVNVAAGAARARRSAAVVTRAFNVPEGVHRVAIELTADRIGPRVRLTDPSGRVVVTTGASGREIGADAAWFTDDEQPRQVIVLKDPPAGRWTAQALSTDPQITRVRTAVDAEPVAGEVATIKNPSTGRRSLSLKRIRGVYAGEQLRFGMRTAAGTVPIGDLITVPEQGAEAAKWELSEFDAIRQQVTSGAPGKRDIVVQVLRDGIPIPGRTATVGSLIEEIAFPKAVEQRVRGRRLRLRAIPRAGTIPPAAWDYRITTKAGSVTFRRPNGKALTLWLPADGVRGRLVVRPVINGAVAKGKGFTRQLRIGR